VPRDVSFAAARASPLLLPDGRSPCPRGRLPDRNGIEERPLPCTLPDTGPDLYMKI
jgi:hypothetical protein